ncbi:antitoxin [Gordonia sp. CPCC 205515]|uniref:antitoxin n=1 Tax=Gordonia sp. CPCC 205515 TaxID=3140791 RepID=UPI003AF3D866
MDLKALVDKAKAALKGDPSLIDKGGDAINKATGGKYAGHIDKASDSVKKAVGADDQPNAAEAKPKTDEPPAPPAPPTPPPANP